MSTALRSFRTLVCASVLFAFPLIAQGQGQTAEQVKKNIQALKGLPASQFSTVMDYFASSLGVRCSFCHVQDSTGWQYDKDDKENKKTARKMIQMVKDLNTNSFAGKNEVSCYTCHRGSNEPTKLMPIPPPPARGGREEAKRTPPPSVEEVVAMAEKAVGGTDAMKKVSSRVSKGTSVDGQGHEQDLEIVQKPPMFLATMTVKDRGSFSHGTDGKSAWMSSMRGTRELGPEQAEEMQEEAALFPVMKLHDLAATLRVRRPDTLAGATAYVLEGKGKDGSIERFYVDSASGLLLKSMTVTETMIGNIPEETEYADYRAVEGVKVPFTIKMATVDPRDAATYRFTSVEQNVKIDEERFKMPKK